MNSILRLFYIHLIILLYVLKRITHPEVNKMREGNGAHKAHDISTDDVEDIVARFESQMEDSIRLWEDMHEPEDAYSCGLCGFYGWDA